MNIPTLAPAARYSVDITATTGKLTDDTGLVAIVAPAWEALYSLALDKGKESSEWSYWNMGTGLAISIAAFLGGMIVSYFGFKLLFIIMAAFHLISAVIAARLLRNSKK